MIQLHEGIKVRFVATGEEKTLEVTSITVDLNDENATVQIGACNGRFYWFGANTSAKAHKSLCGEIEIIGVYL